MTKSVKKIIGFLYCLVFCTVVAVGMPQVARAEETQELTLPAGGLEQPNAYEITEEEAAKVPSYDNGIFLYDNSIFSRGTGNYGYNQLSSEQQTLYDSLEVSLRNFNNDDNATYTKISSGYTPFACDFSKAGITIELARRTWIAFRADHPWLFWLKSCSYSSNKFMPIVVEEYENDIATKKALDTTIKNGIQEYINTVEGINDTYEKVRVIHDKIVDKVDYAYKADGKTPEDANWAHSVIGALDNIHNAVVCEGYAKTFSFILNILNIPNVYILGDTDRGYHAWNAVSFDNGNTYYYVDVTWNDGRINNIIFYIYFAMPKDKFEVRHKPDTTNGIGWRWQYDMPNLGNDMEKTYFKKYDAYATDASITDIVSATKFVNKAKEMTPGATCLMLLEDNVKQLVAIALKGILFSSYTTVEYGTIYFMPSDKTPIPVPTSSPTSSSSPVISSGAHIFSDYNYNNPVSGSAIIYGNGMNKKIDGKRVNNKALTVYTDILASYKHTPNSNGTVKSTVGKVIVAVTKTADKPEVDYKKNKVTDTSASKIAKARIKNGQIIVTAVGRESSLVYLWVIDTGSKGTYAYCPIDVKLAPKKIEVQSTSGSKFTNPKIQNGTTLDIHVSGVSGSVKTEDCTYTATVDSKYQSYVQIAPKGTTGQDFTITAKGIKNNKDTKVAVTFTCDQNGKKVKFSLTITK